MLQRKQQRQIRVARKRPLVDRRVEGTKTGDETVISKIKLLARLDNFRFAAAVELRTKANPHGVAHVNQPPDACARLGGQIVGDELRNCHRRKTDGTHFSVSQRFPGHIVIDAGGTISRKNRRHLGQIVSETVVVFVVGNLPGGMQVEG